MDFKIFKNFITTFSFVVILVSSFSLNADGSTYLRSVINTVAGKAPDTKRGLSLKKLNKKSDTILSGMVGCKNCNGEYLFKPYISDASKALEEEKALEKALSSFDLISDKLKSLGVKLVRTSRFVGSKYKQHLIDQVEARPNSQAKNVVMSLLIEMPESKSKKYLVDQAVRRYRDNVEVSNFVGSLTEWCDVKDQIASPDEIKDTFKALSKHFRGPTLLRAAKFVVKSKWTWVGAGSVASLILFLKYKERIGLCAGKIGTKISDFSDMLYKRFWEHKICAPVLDEHGRPKYRVIVEGESRRQVLETMQVPQSEAMAEWLAMGYGALDEVRKLSKNVDGLKHMIQNARLETHIDGKRGWLANGLTGLSVRAVVSKS